MKVALVVNRVLPDHHANLAAILNMADKAAGAGAELILFPEAALSGLVNDDVPAHDLPLGQPVPGLATTRLSNLAGAHKVWLATGLLEREGNELYDSAVLLAPDGTIALKYRRIHPGWHGPKADRRVYRQGTEVSTAATPLGTFAFLICGDLFEDDVLQQVGYLAPDWLLFPFARGTDNAVQTREWWEREEQPCYVERVKLAGVTTLMTNYLADEALSGDNSFGGALVVSGAGEVVASFPPGKAGILLADVS